MIRRKIMKFAPKEHDDKKVKKTLEKHNVPTFEGHEPSKFGAFKSTAKDITARNRKPLTTPDGGRIAPADKTFQWQQNAIYGGGTGSGSGGGGGSKSNPYAVAQPEGNPYARNAATNANVYSKSSSQSSGYSQPSSGSNSNPYASISTPSPQPSLTPSQRSSAEPLSGGSDLQQGYSARPSISSSRSQVPGLDDDLNQTSFDTRSIRDSEPVVAQHSSRSRNYGRGEYGNSDTGATNVYGAPNLAEPEFEDELGAAPTLSNEPVLPSGPQEPQFASFAPQSGSQSGFQSGPQSRAQSGLQSGLQSGPQTAAAFTRGGVPLSRTVTSQSTASVQDARRELFGAAPHLSEEPTSEFDELNRTHTELEPINMLDTKFVPTIQEQDELNALPSELEAGGEQQYTGYSQPTLFEDSEDEDVDYVKREIKQTKQESVESTRRALQIASESELSGRNTLGMLGDQGERLGFAAKTVQLGNVQSRVAAENAEELQRLNRSIFIPNIPNPFNSRRRNQMKEQKLKGQKEYDEREQMALLEQQRETEQRVNDGLNASGTGYSDTALRARQRINHENPARQMYQFEADSEDEELEDELEQNLDGISDAAKRLHNLSLKINDEVTAQNNRMEGMGDRVDDLDHKLHRTTAKMSTLY